MQSFPKYRSHKIVEAFEIVRVANNDDNNTWTLFDGDDPATARNKATISDEVYKRFQSSAAGRGVRGGYFVKYPDNYVSWSPGVAFENGYRLVPKNPDMSPIVRELHDHKVNPANDKLTVMVLDQPGQGNANHLYAIAGFDTATNPSDPLRDDTPSDFVPLLFQNGPISADGNGVNGVTHEALLAILMDRLRGFQDGLYSCKANACALTHLEEAMHWLQQRTIERMHRGVEGTHTV